MTTKYLNLRNSDNKELILNTALSDNNNVDCKFKFKIINTARFKSIEKCPFLFDAPQNVIEIINEGSTLINRGVIARQGIGASVIYHRLFWEVKSSSIGNKFKFMAHGTKPALFYKSTAYLFLWENNGQQAKTNVIERYPYLNGNYGFKIQAEEYYNKPGLCYGKRTNRFTTQILPSDQVFSFEGTAIFTDETNYNAWELLAITNSDFFRLWLNMVCAEHKAYNYIQLMPAPKLERFGGELQELAKLGWKYKFQIDNREEISPFFVGPSIFFHHNNTLIGRIEEVKSKEKSLKQNIKSIIDEINLIIWNLYDINDNEREELIRQDISYSSSQQITSIDAEEDDFGTEAECDSDSSSESLASDLASWLFGAAIGRWDIRFASGKSPEPPIPSAFDALPPISQGMLLGVDGLHPAKDEMGRFIPEHDLLVDDEGENLDLVRRVREVLERVVGERADDWLLELESLLGSDLRAWYRRTFFERHLKRYSKSRRKAPIYWQLGTPSGSYSVWLYYPRLTRDSLFRLLNDVVKPKVAYEEQRLAGLREQNARRSELEPQEALVEELQAFRDEVARVTPLFDPNLDDGVLINAAPLHRLFVHAGWRRDTQTAWAQLVRGDFEWSHMALHLWPERVIPLCAEQRHLALAHDLEGPLKTRSVEDLVAAHTRPSVKDALQALLNASPQAGGRSAGRPARAPRAPRPAPEPRAAAEPTPRAPRANAEVPQATLAAIREVLARFPSGAAKSDVLSAIGIPDGTWNTAITQLLASGDVERQGEKRGTRYFLVRR